MSLDRIFDKIEEIFPERDGEIGMVVLRDADGGLAARHHFGLKGTPFTICGISISHDEQFHYVINGGSILACAKCMNKTMEAMREGRDRDV